MIDLSSVDIIAKYYAPCEKEIKRDLEKLQRIHKDILVSFIDVIPKDQINDKSKKIVITDHLIDSNLYPEKTILRLPDSIFGIYYIPVPPEHRKIELDCNLFINRADINRMFWFYKFIEMGWIDSSAVSYIGSTSRSARPDLSPIEFLEFLYHTYLYPNFQTQHEFARNHVPYQNFQDLGDLRTIMMETKLSVVIETYHERTDAIAFSEKIFRAIQVPRPWVLLGATGSVARLRSMGFDVFDDYVDHSHDLYDSAENVVKQTDAILKQIKLFKDLKISKSILNDWRRRYEENMQILSLWNQTWQKDFEKFMSDIQLNNNC